MGHQRVEAGTGRWGWRLFSLQFVLLACMPAHVGAQNIDRARSLDAVKKEALQNSQSFRFLDELSDRIGPRLTGTSQDSRAGQWALETMRKIGLQSVHPETWQLERGWRRRYARCHLISPFPLELIVASYGWAGSTPERDVEADVVKVDGDALADEARKSAAWTGKVLLVASKDPNHSDAMRTQSQLPAFLAAAAESHAVAVVLRDRRPGIALPHTGPLGFPGRAASIAVIDMAEEQERLLIRMLASGVPVRMRIDVVNEFTDGPISSSNIVGEIVGSQYPEQIVLLGAHLDSWDLGTGAIDDGFGVAAVLGAAKSIVAAGTKPDRTIRFVLFTGEEQGLLGSRAYTRAHQGELKDFVCVLILDWGNGPITKFPVHGHTELAAPLEEFLPSVGDVAKVEVGSGYLTYTDAYSFIFAGVPAIAPLQNSLNYTTWGHSAADTLDKVDAEILTRNSALLALTAIWIADYPTRLGLMWPPARTAQELKNQQASLELLGLWPFPK
jgi:carboxypeptidase Q